MALSWNEIKKRAIEFSKEWEDEAREEAEAKSFWDGFFNVFGISRRRVATFEEPVKKLGDKQGFIDLFWKGQIIVEHKSRGRDLDKAYTQALDYFHDLKESELPKYVLVSDFEKFKLYDLEENKQYDFTLSELHKNIELFGFIAGYRKKTFKEEDPVNIKAAELMGKLHDMLFDTGFKGHALEIFLVRILFCLFADDTGIFEKGIFLDIIDQKTNVDGSDVGTKIAEIFQVLNTSEDDRYSSLDEDLTKLPYVNGKLYDESLRFPSFNSDMRAALLEACQFDWSKISPAVFGSLFQSVMDQEQRRNLGAHYTSEKNIMKLIKPLFLDELWKEFKKVKKNKKKLIEFHHKLSNLNFLDPACGCGNFLVITYREIRLLELEILKIREKSEQRVLDVSQSINSIIDVDQFHGIEIEEWPAKIAEVAMWLMDHQMNIRLSEEFGQYFARLPLNKSANIVNDNALRVNWSDVVSKHDLNYILGNPPFVGKQYQTKEQKENMQFIFKGVKGAGVLDFVTAWYLLGAKYIQGTKIKVAFVSTNSISQGEQVGILWNELFHSYGIKIHFAHRTFQWNNKARGKAAVHVVIVGYANFDTQNKYIYEYEDIKGDPHEIKVNNINPYLVQGSDLVITRRSSPLVTSTDQIRYGSFILDDGHYTIYPEEYNSLTEAFPCSQSFLKPYLGSRELINNEDRWCIWIDETNFTKVRECKPIFEKVNLVKEWRLNSPRKRTTELAQTPTEFAEIRQPEEDYIAIPIVSSERRNYMQLGYFSKNIIASNKLYTLANGGLYAFGIISSSLHHSWMKYITGRIKSDYQYSAQIVYNNFPWPKDISDSQKKIIEEKAQIVLNTREKYPDNSLADLYDPLTMPPDLVKAHKGLDRAVDKSYRSKAFKDEKERIEFLFGLYEEYVSELDK